MGLAGIVAGGIFLVLWVNPLLRGLGFNPWWLMVGVGLLVMFLPSIFGGAGGYGVARYAYGLVSGPVLSAASVGAFVALGLFLKPWLASLPFNPWWLTVLTLPLVVTLLALLVRFRSEIPFDTTRFNVALGLALGLVGIAAVGIFLLLWINPLLRGLSFSPWWLVMPAGALSWSLLPFGSALRLGFPFYAKIGQWTGIILVLAGFSPLFLLLTLLAITASPVWGIPYLAVDAIRRQRREIDRAATPADRGPWVDVEIDDANKDRFGFNEYATVLTNQAISARTPLVIGVYPSIPGG